MPFRRLLILAPLLTAGPEAIAAELGSSDELLSVEVHAFVSQGYIKTTDNNYGSSRFRVGKIGPFLDLLKHASEDLQT